MIPRRIYLGNEWDYADPSMIAMGTMRLVGLLEPGTLEGHHSNFGYAGYVKVLVWDGRVWASLAKSSIESMGIDNTYQFQYNKMARGVSKR